jgi:hypothetical protein
MKAVLFAAWSVAWIQCARGCMSGWPAPPKPPHGLINLRRRRVAQPFTVLYVIVTSSRNYFRNDRASMLVLMCLHLKVRFLNGLLIIDSHGDNLPGSIYSINETSVQKHLEFNLKSESKATAF